MDALFSTLRDYRYSITTHDVYYPYLVVEDVPGTVPGTWYLQRYRYYMSSCNTKHDEKKKPNADQYRLTVPGTTVNAS